MMIDDGGQFGRGLLVLVTTIMHHISMHIDLFLVRIAYLLRVSNNGALSALGNRPRSRFYVGGNTRLGALSLLDHQHSTGCY